VLQYIPEAVAVALVELVQPVVRQSASEETVEPAEQMKSPESFMVVVEAEVDPAPPQVVTPAPVAEVLVDVVALVLRVQQIQVAVVVVHIRLGPEELLVPVGLELSSSHTLKAKR
jgi:hypothetical protein